MKIFFSILARAMVLNGFIMSGSSRYFIEIKSYKDKLFFKEALK